MMSGWGIADTAPKIEKIKAESADYLHGLDSCGKIEWSTYSDMFDFYADLIEKAYAQGKEDAQPEIVTDCHDLTGDLLSRKVVIDAIYKNGCNTRRILDAVEALPSAQPEIIHCENCEHWKNNHLCECLSRYGTFETPKDFFCGYGKAK
jgi:hypothetical protein